MWSDEQVKKGLIVIVVVILIIWALASSRGKMATVPDDPSYDDRPYCYTPRDCE